MTGAQLKHIRLSRGWKLRDMADALRDVSHTTIMRWEDDPQAAIPSWVEERLFSEMPITLPLQDLHTLLDLAREEKVSFEDILAIALREYLASRQEEPADPRKILSYAAELERSPDPPARIAETEPSTAAERLTTPPK